MNDRATWLIEDNDGASLPCPLGQPSDASPFVQFSHATPETRTAQGQISGKCAREGAPFNRGYFGVGLYDIKFDDSGEVIGQELFGLRDTAGVEYVLRVEGRVTSAAEVGTDFDLYTDTNHVNGVTWTDLANKEFAIDFRFTGPSCTADRPCNRFAIFSRFYDDLVVDDPEDVSMCVFDVNLVAGSPSSLFSPDVGWNSHAKWLVLDF